MTDLPAVQSILQSVTLQRNKGEAFDRQGNHERAIEAWQAGLVASDGGFAALGVPVRPTPDEARAYDGHIAADAAELLGVRGGLLRRLNRLDEALASYRAGAVWESSHNLPQTYNRTNAFKLALITGDSRLEQIRPDLGELRDKLEGRLSVDEPVADDAWRWADLGDVRLLLGDEPGAISAYQDFIVRARTRSSAPTLTVLNEVVEALVAHKDPDAAQIAAIQRKVQTTLEAR